VTQPGVQIRLLGEFAFELEGRPMASGAWRRSHARRLLQLICSAPKLSETRARVLSALWPESDERHARNRLHHTVHFIRQALEEVPARLRPQIVVGADHVTFLPGADTLIDTQCFVRDVEADCSRADARLDHIQRALDCFRGPLAPGWDDCALIDTRRTWFETQRESIMREALDLAVEIGRPDMALDIAQRLASLLESDSEAHCRYALLLAENGRPDAALLHCQRTRAAVHDEDDPSIRLLDETVRTIQLRANRRPHEPVAESDAVALSTDEGARRLSVPAPRKPLISYEEPLAACEVCLSDPYGALTTLVGPPGAGKSLLAATVAYRHQSQTKHGALWLDCSSIAGGPSMLAALATGLGPLCKGITADEEAIRVALHDKDLLIVLDGLNCTTAAASLGATLSLAGSDTRWLVTAWSALNLVGERVVGIEPSVLLRPANDRSPSSAAQILLGSVDRSWRFQDARSMQIIEQIAASLDGLPLALEVASKCLCASSPNELWARLQRDPCALTRPSTHGEQSPSAQLGLSVGEWLGRATPAARHLLSLLSRCKSWVTRSDIKCLLGDTDSAQSDSLIDYCVLNQYLLRRPQVRVAESRSEFHVPRFVAAALGLFEDAPTPEWCRARVQQWVMSGQVAEPATTNDANATAARWFDDHIEDIDGVAVGWVECREFDRVAALCLAHCPHWSPARHAATIMVWLEGLGPALEDLAAPAAASLLLARARVRLHLGDVRGACDDASSTLSRIAGHANESVRLEAIRLIDRYEGPGTLAYRAPGSLAERGVDAGESLLRVSQLAVRHAQLPQALLACNQAVEVFAYFGFSRGLLKAHRYKAKIAFALGNTHLAARCLGEVERIAAKIDGGRDAVLGALMQADVLIAQMRFPQAIGLVSELLARPHFANDTALVARGSCAIAWAHYGQGAYPLARSLCSVLRSTPRSSTSIRLQMNTEILAALLDARSGDTKAAVNSVCTALELLTQHSPLPDEQLDLINAAELAVHLQRLDLAAPLLGSLHAFSSRPQHQLHGWVAERVRHLDGIVAAQDPAQGAPSIANTYSQMLASLAGAR
jgi:DNA-binding SARP family transcriptional activator/tetratricopeptide (TPR) repeat protein